MTFAAGGVYLDWNATAPLAAGVGDAACLAATAALLAAGSGDSSEPGAVPAAK